MLPPTAAPRPPAHAPDGLTGEVLVAQVAAVEAAQGSSWRRLFIAAIGAGEVTQLVAFHTPPPRRGRTGPGYAVGVVVPEVRRVLMDRALEVPEEYALFGADPGEATVTCLTLTRTTDAAVPGGCVVEYRELCGPTAAAWMTPLDDVDSLAALAAA